MDSRPSIELLESTHTFPGVYRIKAIGGSGAEFTRRVIEAALAELPSAAELEYTVRATPGGRHTAVTLDVNVQTAEQVRAIYARLHEVEGLTLLF
jgi:putative lipoic acid-binding regulatory protein